jgi:hypothetical protein
MYSCSVLLTAVALSFPGEADEARLRYEMLAAGLEVFPTQAFAYGRSQEIDRLPKKWNEPWLKVLAAISSGKEKTVDLLELLKHEDPKVRTLALAALYQREDGRLLPHLVALLDDKEKTVPEFAIRRHLLRNAKVPEPEDFHEQTVGTVAYALVRYWLEPVGYQVKDFASYWETRKERNFCAGWFLVRLYRASQASSSFDKKRVPLIRAIRKDVDALPAIDRDWTLLWVAAHHHQSSNVEPGQHFATPDERLESAKRLGHERLMDLIQKKEISADPDLAANLRGRDDLILWVLQHAGKLLRAEAAPDILAAEKTLRDRPQACVVAAAELQPTHARDWLHEALSRYAGEYEGYRRAELAAGLWRIVGESELDYLADWFYGEKVSPNPHTPQTQTFLDAIQQAPSRSERKLVARLVGDARLEKLDYQSLRALVQVANGWTKTPLVPHNDLYPKWEDGGWNPKSAADFRILAGWHEKLKKAVAQKEP